MISINLTIHNKAFLLERVLDGIFKNTVQEFEFIACLDGCGDTSEQVLLSYLEKVNHKKLSRFNILYAPNVFETKANNMCLRDNTGETSIIIQDDMVINEYGWDERIIKPIKEYRDVFAVTARCAHNWELNKASKQLNKSFIKECPPINDWSDLLNHIHHADKSNTARDIFAIRDSVNRGPLALNTEDLKNLNYLDEEFAPQDGDDHDLMYRMQKKLGKMCGYYHIDFISDARWGGTRSLETGQMKSWVYPNNHKNMKLLYERHYDVMHRHKFETRILR